MINDSSKIIMFIKMCACGGTNVQSSGITKMFTGSRECLQTRLVRHKAVVRGVVHVSRAQCTVYCGHKSSLHVS